MVCETPSPRPNLEGASKADGQWGEKVLGGLWRSGHRPSTFWFSLFCVQSSGVLRGWCQGECRAGARGLGWISQNLAQGFCSGFWSLPVPWKAPGLFGLFPALYPAVVTVPLVRSPGHQCVWTECAPAGSGGKRGDSWSSPARYGPLLGSSMFEGSQQTCGCSFMLFIVAGEDVIPA